MGQAKIVRILDALIGDLAFTTCFAFREQGWLDPTRPREFPALLVWYDSDGEDEQREDLEVETELQRVAVVQMVVLDRVGRDENANATVARLVKLVMDTISHRGGFEGLIDKRIEFDTWQNFPFPDKPEESALVGSTTAFEVLYHTERGNF